MGARAGGRRVELRLERSGHPAELDVRSAVVSHRGQSGPGPACRREQDNDEGAGKASGPHGRANSNNGRHGPARLTDAGWPDATPPEAPDRLTGPHQREHDEADGDPDDLADPSNQTEGDGRGRREPQGDERREKAALERAETRRDQEGGDLDGGAERLDHGG